MLAILTLCGQVILQWCCTHDQYHCQHVYQLDHLLDLLFNVDVYVFLIRFHVAIKQELQMLVALEEKEFDKNLILEIVDHCKITLMDELGRAELKCASDDVPITTGHYDNRTQW